MVLEVLHWIDFLFHMMSWDWTQFHFRQFRWSAFNNEVKDAVKRLVNDVLSFDIDPRAALKYPKMPFMKGTAPVRRTLKYLENGLLYFQPEVRVLTMNYNLDQKASDGA